SPAFIPAGGRLIPKYLSLNYPNGGAAVSKTSRSVCDLYSAIIVCFKLLRLVFDTAALRFDFGAISQCLAFLPSFLIVIVIVILIGLAGSPAFIPEGGRLIPKYPPLVPLYR